MKARILPEGMATAPRTEVALNRQRQAPGEERLGVYARGYQARMREALADAYEATAHLVGEAAFADLARRYTARCPSREYNLSFAGRHLPEFLTADPLTQPLPFLPEVAALEWRMCEAFHAFERPPVDPMTLAALSLDTWATTRLIFQPSVSVLASRWPIRDLWEARTQPRETIDIEVIHRPQRVMVFRSGWQVRCELLEEPAHRLLAVLLAGQSLGAACNALGQDPAGQPLPLTEWFARWAREGLIVGVAMTGGGLHRSQEYDRLPPT